MMRHGALGVLVVGLLLPAPEAVVRAEDEPGPRGPVFEVDVARVELAVSVRDLHGRYEGGLRARDFTLFEDGREAELVEFRVEESPIHLALVLDHSRSMAGRLDALARGCLRLLDALEDVDRISLVVYNHEVRIMSSGERSSGITRQTLGGIEASGGTALYDALDVALDDLERSDGRRAIIVVTDGQDRSSLRTLDEVTERARAAGIPIYPVTVAGGEPSTDHAALRELARRGGGAEKTIRTELGLARAFRDLARDVRPRYMLTFRPGPGPPGTRSLRVRLDDPTLRATHRPSFEHREGR